jgi:DNA-directed RNA polymerase specialized sigma24 family protein
MSPNRKTRMGEQDGAFQPTHWSLILRARTLDPGRRQVAVGDILSRYRKPVYWYLRRKGYNHHEAEELAQAFFTDYDLVQRANQARGKFRTYLLTALDRYATSMSRKEKARKREPKGGFVRLDAMESPGVGQHAQASPEEVFNYEWASALLDKVLADVEKECCQAGKAVHWEVFRARVLLPIKEEAEPPSLASLCAQHGIPDEVKASNMIITVKRRFETALRRRIRESVSSDDEIDPEIHDLMEILARGAGT